jgi:hypothetical protein
VSAHPAIVYGEAIVTAGCPDRSTRPKGRIGVAIPKWEQMTTAPT